jgi:hypothetical protein
MDIKWINGENKRGIFYLILYYFIFKLTVGPVASQRQTNIYVMSSVRRLNRYVRNLLRYNWDTKPL